MAETGVNGILLQREQNNQARQALTSDAKIEEGSLYEAMVTEYGRFAVRSLYRLLREEAMAPFAKLLPRASRRRGRESPLMFDEVGARAFRFLDTKIRQHAEVSMSQLSTDQRMYHELLARDLGRARAFAEPVNDYIAHNLAKEK
jgi:hypothetical protein